MLLGTLDPQRTRDHEVTAARPFKESCGAMSWLPLERTGLDELLFRPFLGYCKGFRASLSGFLVGCSINIALGLPINHDTPNQNKPRNLNLSLKPSWTLCNSKTQTPQQPSNIPQIPTIKGHKDSIKGPFGGPKSSVPELHGRHLPELSTGIHKHIALVYRNLIK